MIVCAALCGGNLFAQPVITLDNVSNNTPPGWDPEENWLDIDLTDWSTVALGNAGSDLYRIHVGIPGGITDLHIEVPEGQEAPPINLTQDLFPNQTINGLRADMDGAHIPFCTYFTLGANVSLNLTPTPEPSSALLAFLGLAGLAWCRSRRQR
jgi:hypothetical protein